MHQVCQLIVLIKKNIVLRRRTMTYTFMEALVPLSFTMFLVLMRLYRASTMEKYVESVIKESDKSPFNSDGYTIIGYAPIAPATNDFMHEFENLIFRKHWFNHSANVQVVGFKSEYSMMSFERRNPNFLTYGYAFDHVHLASTSLPDNLHIILKTKSNTTAAGRLCLYRETVVLQTLMEVFINKHSIKQYHIDIDFEEFSPTLETRRDAFLIKDMYRIGLIMVGLTTYLVWRSVYLMASERERCILMLLEQMGVNPAVYWLSWFITTFVINELVCVYFATLLLIDIFGVEPVMKASDSTTIFLYFTALAFAVSSYSIMGSVMFEKAETCGAVASIMYILAIFPSLESTKRAIEHRFASLFFASANLINAITYVGELERDGIGYRWTQHTAYKKSEFFISSLLFAAVMYLCIAYLCYQVTLFHKIPRIDLKLSVTSTRKLSDVTIIMLEDSVTVLTGHELSGKAIFMSVLRGETLPSSGSVTIYGLDRVNDSLAVNLITGFCPKELTAIFPELTVSENLQFFSTMKHLCQQKTTSNIHQIASDFLLQSLFDVPVKSLGGSDRRLLQVAIAYLGENKVILLDDPSLNMDTRTKYRLWSIIRDKAYDKTVVVNTNVVDEAEIIADRVAIFLNGQLKCCGTMHYINMFLDGGYHLVIEKKATCNERFIEHMVYSLIENSTLTEKSILTMTFWLPMQATESFSGLFSLLYTYRWKLGLSNFTVNATTLNDIVVDLSESGHIQKMPFQDIAIDPQLTSSSSNPSTNESGTWDDLNEILMTMPEILPAKPTNPMVNKIGKAKQPSEELSQTSTDAFLIHAILKSMAKNRNRGNYLRWSQTMALFKKKLILSTSAFYIEMLQIILLLIMSMWSQTPLVENLCLMNECRQETNFTTSQRTVIPFSQGMIRTNMSRQLANQYRKLFNTEAIIIEYDERNVTIKQIAQALTNFKLRAIIGASFGIDEKSSSFLRAKAYYLSNDVELGSSILLSLSAVMNAFLQCTTDSDRYSINVSTQRQMTEAMITSDVTGDEAQKKAQRFSHQTSVINAISLLMVPYFPATERNLDSHDSFPEIISVIRDTNLSDWTSSNSRDVRYKLTSCVQTGSKHLQLLSGATPLLYWITSYIFDFFNYMFLCNTFSLATNKERSDDSNGPMHLMLTILFITNGVMMIVYIYVMQSLFSSPSTAVGFILICNYCLGNPSWTMHGVTVSGLTINDYLSYIFLMAPPYLLPQAVYHLTLHGRAAWFCSNYDMVCNNPNDVRYREDCCQNACSKKGVCIVGNIWSFSSHKSRVLLYIAGMLIHILIWGILLAIIEYNVFNKLIRKVCPSIQDKRATVVTREDEVFTTTTSRRSSVAFRILQGPLLLLSKLSVISQQNYCFNENVTSGIIFQNVRKKKADEVFIFDISLKIEKGNLFCFAGVDIEAPCTVVNMICGLEVPSAGKILVNGKGFDSFGRPRVNHIGYCSNKTTGVMPTMTGDETLKMFASLRGVAKFNIRRLVEIYLTAFHLDTVANSQACNYSDCELRRLSIAAALIGEPEISLLCDPLYKLDSESKEAFWKWLRRLTNLKKTIVIASDNLKEMGNHGAYIMILVEGRPVSMGTSKSIESLYCMGYALLVRLEQRCKADSANLFLSMLTNKLPQSQLFHSHRNLLHFHLPYEQDFLANMFDYMEEIKKHIKIESYRINRATLEQVLTAAQKAYFVHGVSQRSMRQHIHQQEY